MIEAEVRIVSAEDHIFTYELTVYGHGAQIFHVTTLDCMAEMRSCDSLAREGLEIFAAKMGISKKELSWIQSN